MAKSRGVRRKRGSIACSAWLFTALVLALGVALICWKWSSVHLMDLNQVGDFAAGIAGILAVIWVVAGFKQQSLELRQNTSAVRGNARLLRQEVRVRERQLDQAQREWRAEIERNRPETAIRNRASSGNEYRAEIYSNSGRVTFLAPASPLERGLNWRQGSLTRGTLIEHAAAQILNRSIWFVARASTGEWFAMCGKTRGGYVSSFEEGPWVWLDEEGIDHLERAGFPVGRYRELVGLYDDLEVGARRLQDVEHFARKSH